MKISDDAKNRLMHTLHPLLRNDGTDEMASRLMQNVANDADDDDGRWVTTEEGNHMFINGEGEPTKGNPYVLAAAKSRNKSAPKSSAKPNKYRETAEKMKEKSKQNPNNMTYAEMMQNYTALADAADKFNPDAFEHNGLQAVVALENAKIGDTVEISGNIFEGTYKLENVKSPFNGQYGPAWVAQDKKNHKHAFANNPATIMSEMQLIKGGKAVDDQSRSVTKVKNKASKAPDQESASKKLQNESEGKSANSSKSAPANTSKPRKPAGDNAEDAQKYSDLLETGKVNEVSSMMDDMPAGTIVQGRSVTMVKQEDGSWRTGSSLDYIGHKSVTANEAAKKIAETNGRWGVDVNYPRVHEHNADYDAPEFSTKSQKKKALKNVTPDDAKALVQRIEERRDKFRAEYKKVDDAYEKYVEEHTKPGMSEYEKLQVKNAAKSKHSLYSIKQGYANESAEDFEIAEKWGNSFGSKRGVSREVYDLIHDVYYTNYARSIDKYEYA